MATFEIPLSPEAPSFSFFTDLEDRNYQFDFRWNSRTENWMFDLYDDADEAVQLGNTLIVGFPMLFQNRRSNRPPGILFAISEQGRVEPDRFNLGVDIKFYYTESENG